MVQFDSIFESSNFVSALFSQFSLIFTHRYSNGFRLLYKHLNPFVTDDSRRPTSGVITATEVLCLPRVLGCKLSIVETIK